MSDARFIEKAIRDAIDTRTAVIVEEEMKGLRDRVEKRVRGEVGAIAAQVASRIDYRPGNFGADRSVTITVRFPEGEQS